MPAFTIPYTKRQAPVATVNPSGRQLWVRAVDGFVFCESGWVVQNYQRPAAGLEIAPAMAEIETARMTWRVANDGYVWVEVMTDRATWKISAGFGAGPSLPQNRVSASGAALHSFHPLARIERGAIKPILAGAPLCLTAVAGSAKEFPVCDGSSYVSVKFLVIE